MYSRIRKQTKLHYPKSFINEYNKWMMDYQKCKTKHIKNVTSIKNPKNKQKKLSYLSHNISLIKYNNLKLLMGETTKPSDQQK